MLISPYGVVSIRFISLEEPVYLRLAVAVGYVSLAACILQGEVCVIAVSLGG